MSEQTGYAHPEPILEPDQFADTEAALVGEDAHFAVQGTVEIEQRAWLQGGEGMQVQGAAADLEADRDRQLVEFVQVLAVGEGGVSCMSSSSSCVEWSWQRAQGRPSRTPSSAASGR